MANPSTPESRTGRPLGASVFIVATGLILGALLGGTAGCSLFSKQMAFLHGGVPRSCVESPVILLGSAGVGAMIGTSCALLSVVYIYLRGRLTVYYSMGGAALAAALFASYIFSGAVVKGFENYIFTGAFIALCGLALGALAGMIADHLRGASND
jgi:hypothetical protein